MRAEIREGARAAGDNPIVEKGARVGFLASGLLHLLLAWVAVQLAWWSFQGEADQQGALNLIASSSIGSVLLWASAVGFAFLALWQVTEVIGRHDTGTRLKAAGRAVVYGALAWTAVGVVHGAGSGGGPEGSLTAQLLAKPYGRLLVGAVGLAVIGVGTYHVVKGVRAKFLEDLREHPGTWVVRAGRFGYVAKGVALGLVGALFVSAAATTDAEQADGLDGALRAVLDVPMGKVLLTIVALGFAAYGVYSFARARYARV